MSILPHHEIERSTRTNKSIIYPLEVELLSFNPNPEKLIYHAAKSTESRELKQEYNHQQASSLIGKLMRSYATSPLEHAYFTFLVKGISRACSHQLVRHRIASYTQQSQRYTLMERDFVIPASIKDGELMEEFRSVMNQCWDLYNKLISRGIPLEDARYVLPNAAKTNIYITMNARSLLNFFENRCCKRAQHEIRELAWKMLELVEDVAPNIFSNAGPYCVRGYCPFGLMRECEIYHQRVKGKRMIRRKLMVAEELELIRT